VLAERCGYAAIMVCYGAVGVTSPNAAEAGLHAAAYKIATIHALGVITLSDMPALLQDFGISSRM